jgi:Na+/proline symporter
MYLVSPIFWMLPPMIYRVLQPMPDGLTEAEVNDLAEQAYINACQLVLPAGTVGLMVAAMISATASMATTQLNVYAGALTTEVYQRLLRPLASAKELVRAGRVCTALVGLITLVGTMLIPRMGTYTGYIIAVTAMLTGPLVLPTIWGLFSKRLTLAGAWVVTILGAAAAFVVKFGLAEDGFLTGIAMLDPLTKLVQENERVTDLVVGTGVSLVVLLIAEFAAPREAPGWSKVVKHRQAHAQAPPVSPSPIPALISGWTVTGLGVVVGVLAVIERKEAEVLGCFAGVLLLVGGGILLLSRWFAGRRVGTQSIAQVNG